MVAFLVAAHRPPNCGLQALERSFSSWGAQAYLLYSMWNIPRPGIKPVSPALAGRFLSIALPGKPENSFSPQLIYLAALGLGCSVVACGI